MPEVISPQAVTFDQAIDFYREKIQLPTKRWADLWQGQHARAFTVAGATKAELLADLYSAVEQGLSEGITPGDFRKQFDDIVQRHGWDHKGSAAWRSGIIFNTNMRTSYQAGRYKQMKDPDVVKARPYWMYDAVNDNRTRAQHKEWDGLVLAHDDPWWETHYPPNGWGCRCRVRNLSDREMERRGLKVAKAPEEGSYEWTDPVTGEVHDVPMGIDPGWAYNVGEAAWGREFSKTVIAKAEGPWVDLDPRGPAAFNRPERIPAREISAKQLEKPAQNAAGLRKALRDAIGGDEAMLADPTGETVLINQAMVDHMLEDPSRQDGREAYFPLIRQLIEDPYEIWVNFVKSEETGKVAIRKKYVTAVRVDKNRVVGLVAQVKEGSWESFSFFRGGMTGAGNLRRGRLLYGK